MYRAADRLDQPLSIVLKEILAVKERAVPEDVRKYYRDLLIRCYAQLSPRGVLRKDLLLELRSNYAEPILCVIAVEQLLA